MAHKDQVTLTHMSLRAAAKALGANVYQVQMLLADGVLARVQVIGADGVGRMQIDAASVRAEVERRAETQKRAVSDSARDRGGGGLAA